MASRVESPTTAQPARGVSAIGWYVPAYRLDRSEIARTLRVGGGRGTRAVASYDEDTTTMGVEAARAVLRSGPEPACVWFATARPTYLEKSNASVIATALGLGGGAAFDVGGAVRSGAGALLAAARGADTELAVLSDLRYGLPGSADDLGGGDAAVAVVFGGDPLAELVASASISEEVMERWRPEGVVGPATWDARWGGEIYAGLVTDVIALLREQSGLLLDEVDHLVVTSPSPRASKMARPGIRAGRVIDDSAVTFGATGTAQIGLLLADALAHAVPGETILVVQAVDGADAMLFRATDRVVECSASPLTADAGRPVDYPTYLTWRGLLTREPVKRPAIEPPAGPAVRRNEAWKFSFTGDRCRQCATVHLPPQRVCMRCGAVDEMEPVAMRDQLATVKTFTVDRISASPSPPTVVGVIDFEAGGRYRCQLTDTTAEAVEIGTTVAMTFRVVNIAPNGIRNYFWKARPIDGAPTANEETR